MSFQPLYQNKCVLLYLQVQGKVERLEVELHSNMDMMDAGSKFEVLLAPTLKHTEYLLHFGSFRQFSEYFVPLLL